MIRPLLLFLKGRMLGLGRWLWLVPLVQGQEVMLLLGGQDGQGGWVQEVEVVPPLHPCSLPTLPVQLYAPAAVFLGEVRPAFILPPPAHSPNLYSFILSLLSSFFPPTSPLPPTIILFS